MTDAIFGARRVDPDYYRRKAAQCRALAAKPAHRTHAKILMKMAARFESQASWPDD